MARQICLLAHRSPRFSFSRTLLQIGVLLCFAATALHPASCQQVTPSPVIPPKPQSSPVAPASGDLHTSGSLASPSALHNPGQPPGDPKKAQKASRPGFLPGKSGEDQEQRAFLQTLTPEHRQKFLENKERWKNLPPEQQAELRKNEEFRRKRILNEINEAITRSGLQLDQEQRQLFTFRFAQERRTIEEDIRKEMEEKRRYAVNQLIVDLAAEFKSMPPKVPSVCPSPTLSGTSTPKGAASAPVIVTPPVLAKPSVKP